MASSTAFATKSEANRSANYSENTELGACMYRQEQLHQSHTNACRAEPDMLHVIGPGHRVPGE